MKLLLRVLAFGLGVSGAALFPRQSGCCFQINVGGGPGSGLLGQYTDGQNRVGPGYPAATYCLNGTMIYDSSGRGCIITSRTAQFQCDSGATGSPGFTIGCGGEIYHNGSSTFYECAVDNQGVYNIYTQPIAGGNCSVVTLTTAGGACGTCSSTSSTPTPTPTPTSTPASTPAPSTSIVTSTITTTATITGSGYSTTATVTGPGSTATIPGPTVTITAACSPTTMTVPGLTVTSTYTEIETIFESCGTVTASGSCQASTMIVTATGPGEITTVTVTESGSSSTVTVVSTAPPSTVTVTITGTPAPPPTTPASPPPTTPASPPPTTPASHPPTSPASPPPTTSASPPPLTPPTSGSTITSTETETQTISTTIITSPLPTPSSCPTDIPNTNFQFPHLIIPISSVHPNVAYGTQYFGTINSTTSTIFNFDIPASYAGDTCTLMFLLPPESSLTTSSYTISGSGGIEVLQLTAPAMPATTYNNAPSVVADLGTFTITAGSSTMILTGACAAGMTISYELKATGSLSLSYFQDYNVPAIGLFITEC